jgi:anti-sigma factor RsiW
VLHRQEEDVSTERSHLDDVTLQAFLEGELAGEMHVHVESHLATCGRCSAQLEGWAMLLSDLEELPGLRPSQEFGPSVLDRLSIGPSSSPSVWSKLRSAFSRRTRQSHPTSGALQDLVDGLTTGWAAARLRAHLESCAACAKAHGRWERLQGLLEGLGRFRPAPEFAHAVMRRLRLEPRPLTVASRPSGVLAAARTLFPSTRRGWVTVGVFAIAPTVGMIALFSAVALHPLLTLDDLLAFGVWRISDLARVGLSWAFQTVTNSSLLFQGYTLVQALASSPAITLTALVGIWTAVAAAGWILYRNVVAPNLTASRHG